MDEVIFFASHAPVRSTRRRFPTPWSSRARVTRVSRWVFENVLVWFYRYFSLSVSYSVRAMSASLALSAAAMISVGRMESSSAASSE